MDEEVKIYLGRILMLVFVCALLIGALFYFNSRWAKIRDIRRLADSASITKALDFYFLENGFYPEAGSDDGNGWDKTNDPARVFIRPLSELGLISSLIFDPKNNEDYFYRYQKFVAGEYGCDRPFAVFQIASFETTRDNAGIGACPDYNFTALAPAGFTWFASD